MRTDGQKGNETERNVKHVYVLYRFETGKPATIAGLFASQDLAQQCASLMWRMYGSLLVTDTRFQIVPHAVTSLTPRYYGAIQVTQQGEWIHYLNSDKLDVDQHIEAQARQHFLYCREFHLKVRKSEQQSTVLSAMHVLS